MTINEKHMLTVVQTANLRPNPFRRLAEYPIIREKIDALKESIDSTGFWGTIVGRPHKGSLVEIAFGHHRLQALKECKIDRVEIIVRDLSNEQMLKMMARENLEEWGTSAWVEIETIRSTIDAYGKGLIELPKVPAKTRKDQIRDVSHGVGTHQYTIGTIALFLGWTREHDGDRLQPNYACETAFKALDMIDAGRLREADLKGLKRSQLGVLITEQWAVYNSEKRIAEDEQQQAELAEERAKAAPAPERIRLEKRASIHREQAQRHEAEATRKARDFGQEAADLFRADRGRDAVKARAAELKPVAEQPSKLHEMDDFMLAFARKLENVLNYKDELGKDYTFISKNLADSSQRARDGVCDSLSSLIDRIEGMRKRIASFTRSHTDGTGGQYAPKAINAEGNGRH